MTSDDADPPGADGGRDDPDAEAGEEGRDDADSTAGEGGRYDADPATGEGGRDDADPSADPPSEAAADEPGEGTWPVLDRLGLSLEQAWAAAVGLIVLVFGGGSLVFRREIYVEFVWHYFWGPVYADAHGWQYAAWADGEQVQVTGPDVAAGMGPVAEPGYTIYSEIGYAVVLLVMLVGVALLLRRLRIRRFRALFYALFPFVPLGGALRVLEDANNALAAADDTAAAEAAPFALEYPLNTLFISPIIYFTMFALTLGALLLALSLHRRDVTETWEYPLAGIGLGLLTVTVGGTLSLALSTDMTINGVPRLEFYPIITVLTLVLATVATGGVWGLIERYAPHVNRGTGYMGLVVIWGQSVDGVANVIGLDWYAELIPVEGVNDLTAKHPVNRFVQDVTGDVLPESITMVTGDAWTFLVLKLVAAVFVVWVFDEEIFEESPRFAFMLLLAVVAVGLGPGTRDMLRATFLV